MAIHHQQIDSTNLDSVDNARGHLVRRGMWWKVEESEEEWGVILS